MNIKDPIYINYKRLVIPEEYKLCGYDTMNDSYYTNPYLDNLTNREMKIGAIEEYTRKSDNKLKIYDKPRTEQPPLDLTRRDEIIDTTVRCFEDNDQELETSITYPLRIYNRNREIQPNSEYRNNNTIGKLSLNMNYKTYQTSNFNISTDPYLNNGLHEGNTHPLLLQHTNNNQLINSNFLEYYINEDLKNNIRDIDDENWEGLKIYSLDEIHTLYDNDDNDMNQFDLWSKRLELKKTDENEVVNTKDNKKDKKAPKKAPQKDKKVDTKSKSIKQNTKKDIDNTENKEQEFVYNYYFLRQYYQFMI